MNVASKKACLVFVVFVLFSLFIFPVRASLIPIEWVDEIEYYALLVDEDTSAEIVVVVLQSLAGTPARYHRGAGSRLPT